MLSRELFLKLHHLVAKFKKIKFILRSSLWGRRPSRMPTTGVVPCCPSPGNSDEHAERAAQIPTIPWRSTKEKVDNEEPGWHLRAAETPQLQRVSPHKFTPDPSPPLAARPAGAAAITQRCSFRGGGDGNSGNIQGGHRIPGLECPSHPVPKPAAGRQPEQGGLCARTPLSCRRQPLTAPPSI